MKKLFSTSLAATALLLAAALPTHAQDDGGGYIQVQVLTVAPSDQSGFEAAVEKVVEAAGLAGLTAEFAWAVYQDGNDFHIVSQHASMADFDDEERFMSQFMGTPGEAAMGEGFGMFSDLDVSGNSYISVPVPEWSYMPEGGGPAEPVGSVVFQTWVKNGQDEAYSENTEAIMGLFEEMNYPYPINGYRVIIGDTGLTIFVVSHDGLDKYYGENSIPGYVEASGLGERFGEIFAVRPALTKGNDNFNVTYRADLSYFP